MKLKLSLLSILIILSMLITSSGIAANGMYAEQASSALESPLGTAFTYQGRLMDSDAPANGTYNFRFYLWADQAKTTLLGTVPPSSTLPVSVTDGYFTVTLDFGGGIFTGEARWLEIEVDGTRLSPLQSLTAAPYSLYTLAAPWSGLHSVPAGFADNVDNDSLEDLSCASGEIPVWTGAVWVCATSGAHSDHDHWGQEWSGSGTGLTLSGGDIGLSASGFNGVYGESYDGYGVHGQATASSGYTRGVFGETDSASGTGVYGKANNTSGNTWGVFGLDSSTGGHGVGGIATAGSGDTMGVVGQSLSTGGWGVWGIATASTGTTYGVVGESGSTSGRGVKGTATATSGTTYGVLGYSSSPDGYAGYFRNTSSGVGLSVQTDSGSGNIIEVRSGFGDIDFRVARNGNVYADGTFQPGGADYAELLPGVAGLVPGEVLVIGSDGLLNRANQPYQTSVVGVYSTQPGFLAGAGDENADLSGQIPLAVMGVVPVKVTAENGPIHLGDLLSSSSTPGHAMRAGVDPEPGTIIGKALEPWETGNGVIQMLVMLR